jgi:integrase
MGEKNPSYLILRNGIYYFHCRIPERFLQAGISSKFVRKSTRTSDRKTAITMAKRWWIRLMDSDFKDKLDKIDKSSDEHTQMFRLGEKLQTELDKKQFLRAEDEVEFLENLLDAEGLQFNDYIGRCLELYSNTKNKHLSQNTRASNPQAIDAYEKFNKIFSKNYKNKNKSIPDLIDEFMAHKANSSANTNTLKDRRAKLDKFHQFIGDIDSQSLTEKNVSDFLNLLFEYPNINRLPKKDQMRDFQSLIDLSRDKKLEKISHSTISGYVTILKSFLNWGKKRSYFDAECLLAFDGMRKLEVDKKPRIQFSNNELKLIFGSDDYKKGLWINKKPFRYWGPIIALYTGARRTEFCQLMLADIKKDSATNIYYFDILTDPTEDEGLSHEEKRRVKNQFSRRKVPIHKELLNLGFLNYVKQLKKNGEKQLFPSFKSDTRGLWGRPLGRWFNEKHLKDLGIKYDNKGRAKSIHCFRHTFINYEKQNNLNSKIIREVTGHSLGSDAHYGYQDVYDIIATKKEIDKIDYGFDISIIKKFPK